jgi:tetratricopeptide (TPR) repeat protein
VVVARRYAFFNRLLGARAEADREALRAALDAAAVFHWFDAGLLSKALGISEAEATRRVIALDGMPFIEEYRQTDHNVRNVHESTRLGWQKQLASENGQRFRDLSKAAADCFAGDGDSPQRIEWIYHRFCADPELAADELEELNGEWLGSARPEERYSLEAALSELERTKIVEGAARVEVLLFIARTRNSRGDAVHLETLAREALALSRQVKRKSGEARANGLLGDVFQAQGRLPAALVRFERFMTISQSLVAENSAKLHWQGDLAAAQRRLGEVWQIQRKLEDAQRAFQECLSISRRLAKANPNHAGRQHELALARSELGAVLQARGNLRDAQAAFKESLTIIQELTHRDPNHSGWQRELSLAHSAIGGVLMEQGNLGEAQTSYEECLKISRQVAERDPNNADWQRGLAIAHSRVGEALQRQGDGRGAQKAFGKSVEVMRRLVSQDPRNLRWQRDLGVAHGRVGEMLRIQGKLAEAENAFNQSLTIQQQLAAEATENMDWRSDLATTWVQIGEVAEVQRKLAEAEGAFKEALRLHRLSAVQEPDNPLWEQQVHLASSKLDDLLVIRGRDVATVNDEPLPAKLFICYSSQDADWRRKLASTFALLETRGYVKVWYDRMVGAGDDWNQEVQEKLHSADIVLCLVSTHFLSSEYINKHELPKALAMHDNGRAKLIPLVLTYCSWEQTRLSELQTATGDRTPFSECEDLAKACLRLERQLQNTWRALRGLRELPFQDD